MSLDQGIIIAKRSISLSKTYLVIGIFLAFMGALISSLSGVVGNLSSTGIPINATSTGGPDLTSSLPLISVALQVFAAIIFATPILLLYVYDKNNGVLEYFLSLGMSQGDIYKQYLKAALMLSSVLIVAEVFVNIIAVLITGANVIVELEVSGLIVALALPVVSFGSLIMMSFSSLQKQRVGSNQPLGMAIGVFMVMPSYIIPLLLPSLAFVIDLLLAGIIAILAALLYFSSSRLIRREKLLP